MKFTVAKENLQNGLNRISSAVATKPMFPILSNVYIEAKEDGLHLSAYDLETKISTVITAEVEDFGKTTLPAKKLSQIVGVFSNDNILFEKPNEGEEIVNISCKKAKYKMRGLSTTDYPESEEFVQDWNFTLPGINLVNALTKVSYARSEDESRKALFGILLSIRSGMLTVAATDGRRLALVENPFNEEMKSETEGDIIIPSKVVGELVKSFATKDIIEVKMNTTSAKFISNTTTITTKLVDGTYPNYRSVIPANFSHKAIIPRVQFSEALRQASCFTNELNGGVSFNFSGNEMEIKSSSTEFGESSSIVDIVLEGDPINIGFNPTYFIEPLKYLESEQLILKYNDGFSPVALTGDEGFLYILMPLRS